MEKFMNWLDEHELLDYIFEAAGRVAIALGVILLVAWFLALGLAGIVIAYLVFTASAWWLLAFIPWLVLLTITIAVVCFVRDKLC